MFFVGEPMIYRGEPMFFIGKPNFYLREPLFQRGLAMIYKGTQKKPLESGFSFNENWLSF